MCSTSTKYEAEKWTLHDMADNSQATTQTKNIWGGCHRYYCRDNQTTIFVRERNETKAREPIRKVRRLAVHISRIQNVICIYCAKLHLYVKGREPLSGDMT